MTEILFPFADYITDITPTDRGYVVSLRMRTGTIEFDELKMWEYAQEINLQYETDEFNNGIFNFCKPNGWMKIDILLKENTAKEILTSLSKYNAAGIICIPLNC